MSTSPQHKEKTQMSQPTGPEYYCTPHGKHISHDKIWKAQRTSSRLPHHTLPQTNSHSNTLCPYSEASELLLNHVVYSTDRRVDTGAHSKSKYEIFNCDRSWAAPLPMQRSGFKKKSKIPSAEMMRKPK